MKRVFTFVLVLCTLLLLAACGNNQPDSVCEHTFDQWVVEKQATCKEEGLLTRSCTKCNYMEATKIEKTNDHTEVIDPEVPATCEKTGLSEGKHCAVCGKVFVAQQETPIVAHTYDDKYDESCNVCGHIRDAECAHKETEVIAGKAATCTEIGLTEGSKCKKCGEILVAQTTIPVIDHTYSAVVTAPTCTEQGYTTYTCNCSDSYVDDYVAMTDHSFGQWVTIKEATTTEEGLQERFCNCGARETQTIEKVKLQSSSGLEYELKSDGKSYCVSGIGSCTDTDIVIPDTYSGLPVTSIGSYAFYSCESLQSITIPDSVTTIGGLAFAGCDSLTGIWVNEKNPNYSSDKNGVLFNKNQTQLIQAPCKLKGAYTIPDSVTTIGGVAFADCFNLQSITIPDSVTSIGNSAFDNCTSLTSVTIGDSVTTIGNYAFEDCTSLTSVTIGDSVTTIEGGAFFDCTSLTSVTIPDSVTIIGYQAFSRCASLTSVTIPDSVTSIGDGAFENCASLTGITFQGTMAQWKKISLASYWNYKVPATKVICSDGTVRLTQG